MTNYLISYDISDDRLRTRAAKLLERRGCKRLQKSVFFAPRYSIRELRELRTELRQILQQGQVDTDSILCIPVSQKLLGKLLWEGDQTFFDNLMKKHLSKLL